MRDARAVLGQLTAAASRASHVREEMASLSGEVERLRSFLQQSELNLGDLTQRIAVGRSQVGSLESEASDQQTLLDEKTRALEAAREERNRLRDIAEQLEHERAERSDEVRTHEKSLADARESLMRTIAKISEARNQVHQIEVAVENVSSGEAAQRMVDLHGSDRARLHEEFWEGTRQLQP